MLEVNLLGTGGMVPLPGRYLTSLIVRYNGLSILIDCGEGTQVAIRSAGLGFKQIGVICITHFHADHIAGLPGLLLTIGNSGRSEPLTIVGPPHVRQIVECLCVIAPQLPYDLNFIESEETGGKVFETSALDIYSHPLKHWTPCYAYKLELKRQAKFNAEKAMSLGIPKQYWKLLQNECLVDYDGLHFEPSQVLGEERRGIKICYATDFRPSDTLPQFAYGADLLVCEGMYGDPDMLAKAIEHRHCMFTETACIAKEANVKELWLTHFSPSMPNPHDYLHFARDIFGNSWVDKNSATLKFPD